MCVCVCGYGKLCGAYAVYGMDMYLRMNVFSLMRVYAQLHGCIHSCITAMWTQHAHREDRIASGSSLVTPRPVAVHANIDFIPDATGGGGRRRKGKEKRGEEGREEGGRKRVRKRIGVRV